MKLQVKETNGRLHTIEAEPTIPFDRFREMVHQAVPSIGIGSQKLVCGGRLLEAETLKATGLKDGDVLVVLAARSRPRVASREISDAVPTAQAILAATQHLHYGPSARRTKKRNTRRRSSIRRRARSITDENGAETTTADDSTSSSPVADGASPIPAVRRQRLPKIPVAALRGLVEMGFTEGRARKALLLNGMNTQAAMEWLLIHGEDEDIDAPLTEEERQHIIERERSFIPDPEAVRQLGDMGFTEEEATKALWYAQNDHDAALAWLLSDRQEEEHPDDEGDEEGNDIDETAEGDPMNQVLQAILSNPALRAGLQSERVVRALERVMQDPQSALEYLNDPEIGPIILQIHSIINSAADEDDGEDVGLEEEELIDDESLGPMY